MRRVLVQICVLWLLVSGQQGTAQTPAAMDANAPRVIETFNVGDDTYVRALAVEQKKGALWVGTSKGVHEIDMASGKPRHTFTRDSGLANEYVFAIGIDKEGYKWFGTNAGGVSRYRDGKWKTYFPMHGLADYWVYSFANQKNGDLWIGTWAGANVVDLKTLKFRTYVKELINEWVYGLDVDARDQVWFGTEGGIAEGYSQALVSHQAGNSRKVNTIHYKMACEGYGRELKTKSCMPAFLQWRR